MTASDIALMAAGELRRRPLRVSLTVSGVVVAISTLIALLSLSISAEAKITSEFERNRLLNGIQVFPARSNTFLQRDTEAGPPGSHFDQSLVKNLRTIRGVISVTPTVRLASATHLDGADSLLSSVTGISFQQPQLLPLSIQAGRFPSPTSTDEALVTTTALQALKVKDTKSALGRRVLFVFPRTLLIHGKRIFSTRSYSMKIVGVADEALAPEFYLVPMPLVQQIRIWSSTRFLPRDTTLQERQLEQDQLADYSVLWVLAADTKVVHQVRQQIEDSGYRTFSPEAVLTGIHQFTVGIEAILAGIGLIALFISALGIVNTLLMSVMERTREIGIMKAIGAANSDIAWLFLGEAAAIGVLGGVFGLLFGRLATLGANAALNSYIVSQGGDAVDLTILPLWVVGAALLLAVALSTMAGLYPAWRASHMPPLQALRTE